MSGQDDPFADQGDIDATVVRPSPGGRRPPGAAGPVPTPQVPRPAPLRSDDSLFGPAPGLGAPPPQPFAAPPPSPPMPPQQLPPMAQYPQPQPMAAQASPFAPASPLYAAEAVETDYAPSAVMPVSGSFPLVSAAQPLLTLAARLRERPTMADVAGLHDRVVGELRAFERRARGGGATPHAVNAGRYALCALIDDLVLNTPWGQRSIWASTSMVNTFYNETSGGERFFGILEQLHRAPNQNGDVLELMYLCLSLGFEGRYRVLPRGQMELARVRENLYRTIRRRSDDAGLSPHWRGVVARHRPLGTVIPLWVIAVAAFALLVVIYFGFVFALNRESDPVFTEIARLPPTASQTVTIVREAPAPPPQPVVPATPTRPPAADPQPPQETLYDRISGFLQPEVAEDPVVVTDEARSVNVRLVGDNLFASASVRVNQNYIPVLRRVAAALEAEPGRIVVQGHTDDLPINTVQFPSNYQLSLRRAEAVVDILAEGISDDSRLAAEGRADADPLCTDATADCRSRNRRIEVLLMKEGPE